MFAHSSREKHGIRWWLHWATRECFKVEFYWWSRSCGLSFEVDGPEWSVSFRLPPLALYLTLEWSRLPYPQRFSEYTKSMLPDHREFDLAIHDWTIRLTPWGKWGEWVGKDPWWIRGVHFDVREFVLGKRVYIEQPLTEEDVLIAMPEGTYKGVAKTSSVTRGFQRWFKHTADEVWLTIPKGIPHAGKGENSWDCGDDALCGIGGRSIADVIQRARVSVTERRKRHGEASPEAVQKALA